MTTIEILTAIKNVAESVIEVAAAEIEAVVEAVIAAVVIEATKIGAEVRTAIVIVVESQKPITTSAVRMIIF